MSRKSTTPPKPRAPMSDARIGGMIATAVLVLLTVFTVIFVMIAG